MNASLTATTTTAILMFCYLPASFGSNADDHFTLSLKDLLDIEVSVASKIELPLSFSPATIKVYSREDFINLGIHQLADLADITAGYASYSVFGERVLETRGQKASSFENNKHLMLLDGIRLNHGRANKAPIENELPLWTMNKLEMLKGPASSIYGQSAFYGVVSLQSAFSDDDNLFTAVDYTPENQGFRATLSGNLHASAGHSYIALSHFDQDSDNQLVGPDFSPLQQYYNNQNAHFIYARQQYEHQQYGDFTLGHIELSRDSGLGEHWMGDFSAPGNHIEWVTDIDYLSWQKPLSAHWQTSLTLVENNSSEQGTATTFTRAQATAALQSHSPVLYTLYLADVKSRLLEAELTWKNSNNQSVLLGASAETRQDKNGYVVLDHDLTIPLEPLQKTTRPDSEKLCYQGIYLQYYQLVSQLDDIHLTMGVRYDKGEYLNDSFSQWSPRLALVKQLTLDWTIKGSYSTALRSPGLKEYTLNQEARNSILTNAADVNQTLELLPDSLRPETFTAIELSAVYEQETLISQFNIFQNTTEMALDGQALDYTDKDGNEIRDNSFANSSQDFTVYGYEVEIDWRLSHSWHLNTHISYAQHHSGSEAATMDNPRFKASATLTGYLSGWASGWTASLTQRHHRQFSGPVNHISTTDLHLASHNHPKFNWHIKLLNLFDTDNFYPANGKPGNPLPGSRVELGFAVAF